MKSLYLIANPTRKPEVAALLHEHLPWLKKIARIVGIDKTDRADLSQVKADFLVVFGGDGTLLSVARRLKGNPIPVLGVNLGTLGFLAEVSCKDLKAALPWVLRGDYVLSPRMMIRTTIPPTTFRGKAREFITLNEAVILRQPDAGMVYVRVTVSGEEVAHYRGDGLIVSTATGSTGYNLSAGGPILSERLKALIVTPICPHTLANRPIVLSGDETVEVVPEMRFGHPFRLVLDGQVSLTVKSGTQVVIGRGPHEFNLVTLGRKGRYEIIRDKLHWAGWVKEER